MRSQFLLFCAFNVMLMLVPFFPTKNIFTKAHKFCFISVCERISILFWLHFAFGRVFYRWISQSTRASYFPIFKCIEHRSVDSWRGSRFFRSFSIFIIRFSVCFYKNCWLFCFLYFILFSFFFFFRLLEGVAGIPGHDGRPGE